MKLITRIILAILVGLVIRGVEMVVSKYAPNYCALVYVLALIAGIICGRVLFSKKPPES